MEAEDAQINRFARRTSENADWGCGKVRFANPNVRLATYFKHALGAPVRQQSCLDRLGYR